MRCGMGANSSSMLLGGWTVKWPTDLAHRLVVWLSQRRQSTRCRWLWFSGLFRPACCCGPPGAMRPVCFDALNGDAAKPTPAVVWHPASFPPPTSPPAPDMPNDSDSGDAPSSNASVRIPGRRTCQANCVWLSGKPSGALDPSICTGTRIKPATLMYGDLPIQHGERVRSANFPLAADLRTPHRLDYAGQKNKYKCTQLGCWRKGAPAPTGWGLECTLHAEVRLGGQLWRAGNFRVRQRSRAPPPPGYKIRKNLKRRI